MHEPEDWEEGYEPRLKRGLNGHVWIKGCQCYVCLFCLRASCYVGNARCQGVLGKALAQYEKECASQEPAPKETT